MGGDDTRVPLSLFFFAVVVEGAFTCGGRCFPERNGGWGGMEKSGGVEMYGWTEGCAPGPWERVHGEGGDGLVMNMLNEPRGFLSQTGFVPAVKISSNVVWVWLLRGRRSSEWWGMSCTPHRIRDDASVKRRRGPPDHLLQDDPRGCFLLQRWGLLPLIGTFGGRKCVERVVVVFSL